MTANRKIVGAIVVLAVLGFMWVPASHASSITAKLSPSTNSANVTAYINTTVTATTNSTILKVIGFFLFSPFKNNTAAKTFNSSTLVFQHMQDALKDKNSNLTLNYLNMSYTLVRENLSLPNNVSGVQLAYHLRIQMNVTGIFNGSTANLAWRAFNTNQSMNISSGTDVNHVSYASSKTYGNSTLNFAAFKTSMSSWNKSYDASTNTTTFSYDAGTTLNTSFNWHFKGSSLIPSTFLNISIVRDPSYSISTPGYAVAGSNTITVQSSPPSSSPNSYAGIVVVAVILIAGMLLSTYTRRRKSR